MATQTSRPMVSETSICNQALSFIGGDLIESIEEPNQVAEWCRVNYPFLRDAVLEEKLWSFAAARAVSNTAETPEWGSDYFKHSIPVDWISVFRVYCDDREGVVEWSLEDRFVLAKSETVYMRGNKRVTDTGKFSNLFVQCLAARLAADMAIPLAQDRGLFQDMWDLYDTKLKVAANRDGMQGRNEKIRPGNLTSGRNR